MSFLFFNNDAMYFFIYTKIFFCKVHTVVIIANKCLFENNSWLCVFFQLHQKGLVAAHTQAYRMFVLAQYSRKVEQHYLRYERQLDITN